MNNKLKQNINMLAGQLAPNQVSDPDIVEAIRHTPRELFVPDALKGSAYADDELPLAKGRFMLEPLVFARMVQSAAASLDETVLVVGAATGYGAAVLAKLAARVIALEESREMADRAKQLLAGLKLTNAEVVEGPLVAGYAKAAPYGVILVEGAIATIPDRLKEQLAEGGRLVAVERVAQRPGSAQGLGRAVMLRRENGLYSKTALFDASAALLPGFEAPKGFIF